MNSGEGEGEDKGKDTVDACAGSCALPVTIRELPYLNTMHYIVRVISYISAAK